MWSITPLFPNASNNSNGPGADFEYGSNAEERIALMPSQRAFFVEEEKTVLLEENFRNLQEQKYRKTFADKIHKVYAEILYHFPYRTPKIRLLPPFSNLYRSIRN
eukprot:GEMP01066497.1.p1 GENE.GEMP01066497.1~~GEMP01066497.1.p1  ORF type:complete len:105 (-),score=2.18 GEMP01066497.1:684-998(-)